MYVQACLNMVKKLVEKYADPDYHTTKNALAGNRTRAARVAGEHSTTEPPVLFVNVFLYSENSIYF